MVTFIKRVITLCGKKTSMRLTDLEWHILENICRCENIRRNKLLNLIKDHKSTEIGLTCAVRLFMLIYANKNLPAILTPQKSAKNITLIKLLNLID